MSGIPRAPQRGITPQELRDRSQRFALDIDKFCETLPPDKRSQEIASQLHDAAHSVAMNYRATCRARSTKEFISKLCIVVEEADEAQGWLDTLVKSQKVGREPAERLLKEATELVKIFTASKATVMRNDGMRPSTSRANTRRRRIE